jgi:hypothetical protein
MRLIHIRLKRVAAAVVAAVALATVGPVTEAQALIFGSGDLVFALYNNDAQFLKVLGQTSTLLAPNASTTFNLTPDYDALGSGGITQFQNPIPPATSAAPLKWSIFSFTLDEFQENTTAFHFSSTRSVANWTPVELHVDNLNFNAGAAAGLNMSTQLSGTPGTIQKVAFNAPASFTSKFGTSGTFNSAVTVSGEGGLGDLRFLLLGDPGTEGISDVGHAILSANGLMLTINQGAPAPIPIPSAIVLFGTGLIGLVGIARRSGLAQRSEPMAHG